MLVDKRNSQSSDSDDEFAPKDATQEIPDGVPLFREGGFYLRYYSGQISKQHGREFLEFDFRPDGLMRYANESAYRDSSIIRKQSYVSFTVLEEVLSFVTASGIMGCDSSTWPQPQAGHSPRTELEIILGDKHVCFTTAAIKTFDDVSSSQDPAGLKIYYYLCQDLRAFMLSLIQLHFRLQPF